MQETVKDIVGSTTGSFTIPDPSDDFEAIQASGQKGVSSLRPFFVNDLY